MGIKLYAVNPIRMTAKLAIFSVLVYYLLFQLVKYSEILIFAAKSKLSSAGIVVHGKYLVISIWL